MIKPCFPSYLVFNIVNVIVIAVAILFLDGKRWQSIRAVESEIVDKQTELDVALVYASKHLVSDFMREHRDMQCNGISLEEVVRIVDSDNR